MSAKSTLYQKNPTFCQMNPTFYYVPTRGHRSTWGKWRQSLHRQRALYFINKALHSTQREKPVRVRRQHNRHSIKRASILSNEPYILPRTNYGRRRHDLHMTRALKHINTTLHSTRRDLSTRDRCQKIRRSSSTN